MANSDVNIMELLLYSQNCWNIWNNDSLLSELLFYLLSLIYHSNILFSGILSRSLKEMVE